MKKDCLKFITCGSVDDGKSTLIGRMLYDSKMIFVDQKQALELSSKVSTSGTIDYSLLLDGLMAEREQGITIDVAYRYFSTEKRNFIVADCPGHEQYTRNMAVGASFADVAILLIDATQGLVDQTRRHLNICSLMGIKHVLLAVNKMDLIHYDKRRFDDIVREFNRCCANLKFFTIDTVPVSATAGDNVTALSLNTPWFTGKTLFEYIETINIHEYDIQPFLMPVQRVCRPDATFRGYQGHVEAGSIQLGDEIVVYPEKHKANVSQLFVGDIESEKACKGQPVTLCLDKEIDISRGQVITKAPLKTTDLFKANILWLDRNELVEGKNYIIKCGTKQVFASVLDLNHRIDIQSGKLLSANKLLMNELAEVTMMLSEKITIDAFDTNKSLGSFILIDRMTNKTAACGVITKEMNRSEHIKWQDIDITRAIRSNQKNQDSKTIWLTGLSGSGKTTLANALEKKLIAMGKHTILLDGDNLRHGLNRDLRFDVKSRVENIRRVSEVCKLMNDAGLIVIAAFIAPFETDRNQARRIIGACYNEVHVATPLDVCEARDVKGLYYKARVGEITNFTGVHEPYEEPINPELIIDTTEKSISECVSQIIDMLFEENDDA